MQVIQHPDATAELTEAGQVYEQKVPTLGGQFLDAVDEAVAVIVAAPERWRIIEEDVRRYLMPRFPYAIYYRMLPDNIRILAFKHHSRHPRLLALPRIELAPSLLACFVCRITQERFQPWTWGGIGQ